MATCVGTLYFFARAAHSLFSSANQRLPFTIEPFDTSLSIFDAHSSMACCGFLNPRACAALSTFTLVGCLSGKPSSVEPTPIGPPTSLNDPRPPGPVVNCPPPLPPGLWKGLPLPFARGIAILPYYLRVRLQIIWEDCYAASERQRQ